MIQPGVWIDGIAGGGGGEALRSHNPARPAETVFDGRSASIAEVTRAVLAARTALPLWSDMRIDQRMGVLKRFQSIAASRVEEMTSLIVRETGKPVWDARAEAQLLGSKVDITIEEGPHAALNRVSGFDLSLGATKSGRCSFRPHGVMAVIGPFNFPAHLPNGHIIPALLMGNTVVLKPSDKTPAIGALLASMYIEALRAEGAPTGVVNLVQGGAAVAGSLASRDSDVDGILFTGSWPVGRRIMEENLDNPGRMLALEMGGNNAAVILPEADLEQAVIECVRCAFITAGQRCTCTRRVIVHEAVAPRVIPAICKAAAQLVIGDPAGPGPTFMGPMISRAARDSVLAAQREMAGAGARVLVPCTEQDGGTGGWYISPGVVQVDRFSTSDAFSKDAGADVEVFGPLLRVAVARSTDEAIAWANATRFGLAASVFSLDKSVTERVERELRAGCVNVNTGTAGASSKLPFGGLGLSGNHRPAGAFSLDYCAYPVAGMIETGSASTLSPGMTFDRAWLG